MHIYSPISLVQYLKLLSDSASRRFAFIPVGLHAEGKKDDHQTMLCVDLIENAAYYLDPNGSTTYFDSAFGFPAESVVELLLRDYFDQTSEFGRAITFVPRASWNSSRRGINRTFDGTQFAGGNCVVSSLMLAHYLSLTAGEPAEAYTSIGENEGDRISLFNGYTKFLYRTCCAS